MAIGGQGVQIVHGAQLGLHLAEIADGIAAVAAALGALQQRHQMQVVDAAVGNIIQLVLYALQRAGKGVHVHQHAHQVMPLVPVRAGFPRPVHQLERLGPLHPAAVQHIAKIPVGLHIVVIQFTVQPFELVGVTGKAGGKFGGPIGAVHGVFSFRRVFIWISNLCKL